ncbi:hypothetical protein WR25_09148 [Diploscapter pachys]|uniref:Uncharacterized protein n=1 Tax=Diploscapter pachys TaxID=2018661 RepID=A0A2A2LI91_9BILA|nr:hypothetical protein WR25_09148 [Diploscapter pachys]
MNMMINLYDKLSKRLLESDMNPEVRAISKRVRTLERKPEMYQEGYGYVFDHLKSTVNNIATVAQNGEISVDERLNQIRGFFFPVGRKMFGNATTNGKMSDDQFWAENNHQIRGMASSYDKWSKRLSKESAEIKSISKGVRALERVPEMFNSDENFVCNQLMMVLSRVSEATLDKYKSIWDDMKNQK